MSRLLLMLIFILFVNLFTRDTSAASPKGLERGRYLVVEVGKCGDCHTPHLASGAPDTKRLLKGSLLGVKPVAEMPGWMDTAPDITSTGAVWQNWGAQALIQFFLTGKEPNGKFAAPPMPSYTLTEEDARAIVAYLKSIQ